MGRLKDRLLENEQLPATAPDLDHCARCGWDFTLVQREVRTKLRVGTRVICDECNRLACDAMNRRREEKAKQKPEPKELKNILSKLGLEK